MLGFHPIAAAPLTSLIAAASGGGAEVPAVATGSAISSGAMGGGAMLPPELLQQELRRLERRQKRIPKTHIIKIGDWPDEVGYDQDPLDMGEILRAQPRRAEPSTHRDDDDEEALMALLALAA